MWAFAKLLMLTGAVFAVGLGTLRLFGILQVDNGDVRFIVERSVQYGPDPIFSTSYVESPVDLLVVAFVVVVLLAGMMVRFLQWSVSSGRTASRRV